MIDLAKNPHDDTESDWKKTDPIQNITIATGSMTLMINIGGQTKKQKITSAFYIK